jgi:GrpB-like predicted nucleotidyltransferase (UPF0157 family)
VTRELEGWLDEVVIGERQPGPIRLVAYDPEWPAQYDRIHDRLQGALGTRARMIEHIGSTAVPGLLAKPIIDVLVTVDDVEDEGAYASAITRLGHDLRVREPGHRMFRPASLDTHVHVWNEGSREQRDHLLLRDWLRHSADDCATYARLKRRLADEDWPDVNYYAQAKGGLIGELLDRAAPAQ